VSIGRSGSAAALGRGPGMHKAVTSMRATVSGSACRALYCDADQNIGTAPTVSYLLRNCLCDRMQNSPCKIRRHAYRDQHIACDSESYQEDRDVFA
jgi:hypothetical protein